MADNVNGKVPPHNESAEAALLGSVMLRHEVFDQVANMLTKEDFYEIRNQVLWENLLEMRKKDQDMAMDLVTVIQFLTERGTLSACGGPVAISELTNSAITSANATYYAQIIKNASLKRQLYKLSLTFADKAFDNTVDPRAAIGDMSKALDKISQNTQTSEIINAQDVVYKTIEGIEKMMNGEVSSGISTGFTSLDYYIGGLKDTDYIIIGARPSVGKTALALSMVHNIVVKSSKPCKVGFFSLEMPANSLMLRLFSRECNINSNLLRNGKLDIETYHRLEDIASGNFLSKITDNFFIQDSDNLTILDIRAQARYMVRELGVQIIFIDYIGLIRYSGSQDVPKFQQFSEISRELKSMARELNVPVVCLSQVGREAGKDRAPVLADLRESGAIEQDADLVILLDDPSKRIDEDTKSAGYTNQTVQEDGGYTRPDVKKIKVMIAKHRNGRTGYVDMNFISDFVSFTDIERF